MDVSHPSQAQSGAYNEQQFAPPPAASGAGQNQPVPLGDMNVHQGTTQADYQGYPPPPPNPPMQTGEQAPSLPPRPQQTTSEYSNIHSSQQSQYTQDPALQGQYPQHPSMGAAPVGYPNAHPNQQPQYGQDPALQGQPPQQSTMGGAPPQYNPAAFQGPNQTAFAPPPQRQGLNFGDDDPSNPIHYTRDPHKLVAYLVPFPKPKMRGIDPATIPSRFLIYTPPPPPLSKPAEGTKENKLHMVQRKWQQEVRSAKTSQAKVTSWEGAKSRVTKGISKAMEYTTSSNLDFLGRVSDNPKHDSHSGRNSPEASQGESTTKKTVAVEEMVLIYPPSIGLNDQQMREEFVNTMLRTKTKAQRDAIISTGLMPVAYGIDILATLVWPFGGLGEIDTVWAYANIRGVKTARSVTKRLNSTGTSGGDQETDKLHLNFHPSQRIELLQRYLASECNQVDTKLFPQFVHAPTETEVLQAIGWHPSQTGGEKANWEDDQWEMTEVKDDLKTVMHKGAKEWKKWCAAYEKDPQKAMKK